MEGNQVRDVGEVVTTLNEMEAKYTEGLLYQMKNPRNN
jgi:hypothetical protein